MMQNTNSPSVKPKQADPLVGQSAWMKDLRNRLRQVANFRYSVLVTGPSGTGKELVARAIHSQNVERCDKPFIPVNCAAIPRELFCSQLFGHAKGAFTGAQYASLGCFRAADGGSIFLDEIGDLDLDSQAKLLRVLQERKVTPVGSHDDIEVDVRTIAATNRNLALDVQAGRFRLDLYYRLNVLTIETLPLASRIEDIEPLAHHFLAKAAVESGLPFKTLEPAALRMLQTYQWPGNVRELQNYIERAVVTTDDDAIGVETVSRILSASSRTSLAVSAGHGSPAALPALAVAATGESMPHDAGPIPATSADVTTVTLPAVEKQADTPIVTASSSSSGATSVASPPDSPPGFGDEHCRYGEHPDFGAPPVNDVQADLAAPDVDDDEWMTLAEVEERHLRRTLKRTYYNQSAAARLLDIDRKLLARKIKKFNILLPTRQGNR